MILFEPNSTDHCYSINIFIWICKMFCRSREFGKSEVFIVGTFHIQCGKRFIKHGCIQRIFFNSCCYSYHLQVSVSNFELSSLFWFFFVTRLGGQIQIQVHEAWWGRVKIFSTSLALCEGNAQMRKFVFCFFLDERLNKLLNKQLSYQWFQTPLNSCDVIVIVWNYNDIYNTKCSVSPIP